MIRQFIIFLAFLSSLTLLAQDRVIAPIDPGQIRVIKGNLPSKAQPQFDLGEADASMDVPYVTMLLKPSAAQQSALDQFLEDLQTPGSPNYHQWITPQKFGERFGLSANDVARVTAWLKSEGLTVNDVAAGRHWITFSGTARQIGGALHTSIHRYRSGTEVRYANATEPSVPEAIADVVAGFHDLDNFPETSYSKAVPADNPAYNSGGTHHMAPADFAVIYNLVPLYQAGIDGTGQKIAIIGRTDINLSDISTFRQRFGLPVNNPTVVLYGPDPGMNSSDLGEADLDLEWSGAVAYNAKIIYVNSKSVRTSAQYAIDNNLAPVMSYSYGSCEQETNTSQRSIAQQAAAQGITWMASSGDSGATACDPAFALPQATRGMAVGFPASIPEITAVGGTMFNEGSGTYWSATNGTNLESALSYIPEVAWNEDNAGLGGLSSSSGGPSLFFAKPAWQTGPGVPNDGARDVPDVSLSASIHDGYAGNSGGLNYFYTGTSASSPSFAGIVALLNQYLTQNGSIPAAGLGNINPALYRLAQSSPGIFHDVTSGTNASPCSQESPNCVSGSSTGFAAGANYDMATGLGSVDAFKFVQGWNTGTSTTTSLSLDQSTLDLNGTLKLTAQVTSSGGGSISGTISFNSADVSLGSASYTAGQAVSVSVPANLLAVGTDTIYAVYSGNGSFNGSSGSAVVTVTIPSSGSVVVASVSPSPVYEGPTDAQGYSWDTTMTLHEIAGVPTTLTGFTLNGSTETLSTFFSTTKIAANGTLSGGIRSIVTPPATRIFGFTGVDANGRTWSQQVTVAYAGPGVVTPSIILTSPITSLQQDPNASSTCPWAQPLFLREQSGFPVTLTTLLAGTTDSSKQLQNVFGTTTLAAWGTLQGTLCLGNISPPQTVAIGVAGVTDTGAIVSATFTASFSAAAGNTSKGSTTPSSVTMNSGTSSGVVTASTALAFDTGSPSWTASVYPPGRVSNWLNVTASGTGSGTLTFSASATGLSAGSYNATVVIAVTNGNPQFLTVPVSFNVGPSGGMTIGGLSNVFSGSQTFAPGMLTSIYGSQLSPATQHAPSLPLPFSMQGVSVTVNGVTAPLLDVLASQINFQLPYETGAGPALVSVNNNGKVASFPIVVAETAPGVWPYFINLSGTVTTSAKSGDSLITFMTGEGDVTPTLVDGATPSSGTTIANLPRAQLPITVTVGGAPATILFYGIPSGLAGASQLNLTLPQNLSPGSQPVVISLGGVPAQTLKIQITQ